MKKMWWLRYWPFCCYKHERKCFRQTWAKDMQWESSSTLATLRDGLCSLRLGNITPSEINAGNKQKRQSSEGQWKREWMLPDEGLLLRGDGGPSRKSGSCILEPLWGGDPNAGKCWRFSSPMRISGSEHKMHSISTLTNQIQHPELSSIMIYNDILHILSN